MKEPSIKGKNADVKRIKKIDGAVNLIKDLVMEFFIANGAVHLLGQIAVRKSSSMGSPMILASDCDVEDDDDRLHIFLDDVCGHILVKQCSFQFAEAQSNAVKENGGNRCLSTHVNERVMNAPFTSDEV